MLKSIRIILEMNVNTNILNGDLEEDVCIMTQTNGFIHPKSCSEICRLWEVHLWTEANIQE